MSSELLLRLAIQTSGGRTFTPTEPAVGAPGGLASVVIPCYRYGHYLAAAVAAALDQPGLDVEVVIVDDASPDDSGEVAERLAAADPRVRVIRHRVNRGHIATYNDGLAAARGDWIALVSADDLLTPGALTRAAALMTAHPGVGFVYGRARHFSGEPPAPRLDVRRWVTWPGEDWLAERCRSGHNVIASPEVVMRGDVARAIGGYRRELPHSGDLEMWLRAATVADVGYLVGPDQALYRQHEANMHNVVFRVDDRSAGAVDLRHRWAAFRTACAGADCTDVDWEAVARRTLAAEALDSAAAARDRGLTEVAAEYDGLADELADELAGDSRRTGSRRVLRRAVARLLGPMRWWRLNRIGV